MAEIASLAEAIASVVHDGDMVAVRGGEPGPRHACPEPGADLRLGHDRCKNGLAATVHRSGLGEPRAGASGPGCAARSVVPASGRHQ